MSTLKVNNIQGAAAGGGVTANITNNLSNRNKVINGDMRIAQRGTSTSGVTGNINIRCYWYYISCL